MSGTRRGVIVRDVLNTDGATPEQLLAVALLRSAVEAAVAESDPEARLWLVTPPGRDAEVIHAALLRQIASVPSAPQQLTFGDSLDTTRPPALRRGARRRAVPRGTRSVARAQRRDPRQLTFFDATG